MIIDCHTHIGFPANDESATGLLAACQGVDSSIVLSVNHENAKNANKFLGSFVEKHPNLIGFGTVNPLQDPIGSKAIAAFREMGLKGLVVYCSSAQFHPAHTRAMRLYEAASELKLPIFFHNCGPYQSGDILEYAQPILLDEVARTFPSLKMIIGNMGLPFLAQTLCLITKHPNVYADLSICPTKVWEVYHLVIHSFEAGVMDKLLFGSGFPSALPGNCIETLLGFNRMLADTNLPVVPREKLRNVIERDTIGLLGIHESYRLTTI